MRKIPLPAKVYAKLEDAAKIKGLTPDELASRIILEKSAEKTCHGCGLEDADKPDYPALETYPCDECIRNPEVRGALEEFMRTSDFFNEAWTLDEKGRPFIEK